MRVISRGDELSDVLLRKFLSIMHLIAKEPLSSINGLRKSHENNTIIKTIMYRASVLY